MDGDRQLTPHPNRLPTWFVVGVTSVPALFVGVFYVWPLATLLEHGLGGGVVADTLSDARTYRVLWFTAWQACVSTVATIVVGLWPTWAIARFEFAGRRLLVGALTAVFVLPTVVVAAAIVALLPDSLEHSVWAIIAAHVVFNLAVVVRTVGAAWSTLPEELEHAAATLGCSQWAVFRYVTLPLLRPAVVASAAVVFLFTFTSFGVVKVLGGVGRATIEVEVWRQATQLGDLGRAATLAVFQLVVLAVVIRWASRSQRRHSRPVERSTLPRRRRPRGRQRWMVVSAAGIAAVAIGLPLVALVERSFRVDGQHTSAAWRSLDGTQVRPGLRLGVDPLEAMWRSAVTAFWATLVAVAIGAAAVVAIDALGRRGRLLDTGLMLPLGTSAVTIGFGMLITFDTPPIDWRAEWWLVPVGQALVAAPFVVRTALGVLRSVSPDLRNAAATLGASPLRAWATTTLPFLRKPVAVGAGLAAAISLGEFGATSFLSRSGADTLPLAIERLLGRTGGVFQAQAFALATILAAATMAIVVFVDVVGGGDRVGGDDR